MAVSDLTSPGLLTFTAAKATASFLRQYFVLKSSITSLDSQKRTSTDQPIKPIKESKPKMSDQAIPDILNQLLCEYGSRISIDGGSSILASDPSIASAIAQATRDVRTPYGPSITIATRSGQDAPSDLSSIEGGNVSTEDVDRLKMDHFTHAVFGVRSEDPKFVLQGLKHMIYALRPKGVAIVISIKQQSGQGQGEQFNVALEDKIKFQSKGKAEKLTDVLEYAGFERGKIRSFERSSEVNGEKVEAEVVLAMKWDQLNA
jgi:hypothetical protein